jgi:hypothetical protein
VCDDVKMSMKLKKVLKTILKVGNQLNDGEDHMGFTVDSLLKLQSQKAFDKKTSILQYVVRLISRNDETCLLFPEDLVHLTESERLSIDQILSEMSQLSSSHQACKEILNAIATKDGGGGKTKSMADFLNQVSSLSLRALTRPRSGGAAAGGHLRLHRRHQDEVPERLGLLRRGGLSPLARILLHPGEVRQGPPPLAALRSPAFPPRRHSSRSARSTSG